MLIKTIEVPDIFQSGITDIMKTITFAFLDALKVRELFDGKIVIESLGTTVNLDSANIEELKTSKNNCKVVVDIGTSAKDMPFSIPGQFTNQISRLSPYGISESHSAIFVENEDQIFVSEFGQPLSMNMEMELSFESATDAIRCAQKLNRVLSSDIFTTSLSYSYILPTKEFMEMLFEFYQLAARGNELTAFNTYVVERSNGQISPSTGRGEHGKRCYAATKNIHDLPIRVTRSRNYGENDGDKSPVSRKLRLQLEVQMSIIDSLIVQYPPTIMNKKLPSYLLPAGAEPPNHVVAGFNKPTHGFLEKRNNLPNVKFQCVPWWDEPMYDRVPKGYTCILQNLIELDNPLIGSGSTLINLIDDLQITDEVLLQLIKDSGDCIFKEGSPFLANLIYNGNPIRSDDNFSYDKETTQINLKSTTVRGVYHLMLFIRDSTLTTIPTIQRRWNFNFLAERR